MLGRLIRLLDAVTDDPGRAVGDVDLLGDGGANRCLPTRPVPYPDAAAGTVAAALIGADRHCAPERTARSVRRPDGDLQRTHT